MGHCRLCHGKFSSRSLRSISGRAPGGRSDRPPPGAPGERVFARDFQRLLGVVIHQDPALSQFVCKNCHAQFYQCHGLLRSFLQRVNVSPSGQQKPGTRWALPPSFIWEVFRGRSRHRDEGRQWLSVQSRPLGERGHPHVWTASLACCLAQLMATLTLCRVGAQPSTGAEDRTCLGEFAPAGCYMWCVGGLAGG